MLVFLKKEMPIQMIHKKFTTSQQAILTTILYSDIFSFPLTEEELWRFLIADKNITRKAFVTGLRSLQKYITEKDGYFCLKGHEKFFTKRIHNHPEVAKKVLLAKTITQELAFIPSVLFIGITGGLAVGNVSSEDDIDLVVIVKKNTLFISRLLLLGILQKHGLRRSHNQKNTANTICLNLLFDETALVWFGNFQDIYTAREIGQIVPLFERENMYQRFMDENKCIRKFLPNIGVSYYTSSLRKQGSISIPHQVRDDSLGAKLFTLVFINPFFESISCTIQMSLIHRHRTTEIVTKHVLAFHPIDYKTKTLKQLRLKMRNLGLLTKF